MSLLSISLEITFKNINVKKEFLSYKILYEILLKVIKLFSNSLAITVLINFDSDIKQVILEKSYIIVIIN
jgi:hypothetical protein